MQIPLHAAAINLEAGGLQIAVHLLGSRLSWVPREYAKHFKVSEGRVSHALVTNGTDR